jgi:hypothetical protein
MLTLISLSDNERNIETKPCLGSSAEDKAEIIDIINEHFEFLKSTCKPV